MAQERNADKIIDIFVDKLVRSDGMKAPSRVSAPSLWATRAVKQRIGGFAASALLPAGAVLCTLRWF